MEGIHVSEANLVVYVHPSKHNKIHQAILRNLSSLLFQFNETFEGIVLAYDFNILDNYSKVLPGIFPYLGVKLKANLLVFSPKQDMLIGKVVKITPESIHVIVLGFSSAIIAFEDIRKEFKYETRKGEELFVSRLNKRHVIKVGTMIRFLVKSFDEAVLHFSGSLMPDNTGSIRWLDRSSEDSVQTDSAKRRKERVGEMGMSDSMVGTEGASSLNNNHVRKSKKHKISQDH
ncbi:probable DNA-directed RNA polymerase I subunit RPA43 isoform X2 [Tripterygium wilfordii]|uniref:probable DNA-directed RNA polymerase I subunit RPA43 isoform X2 n=1 Tax=Tripterygium wilfordii TaxID=458696 RepID=UPI0018F7F1C9|nr:probable DNA-directed RNA polymerase I subunit RPA43 isoform X2 [Tripterygium wilfordii]